MTAESLLAFINRLPITGDRMIWWTELRDGLLSLLGDVDRLAISLNFDCNLIHPPVRSEEVISVISLNSKSKDEFSVTPIHRENLAKEFEVKVENFIERKKFHSPTFFHYYHESGELMGSIVFFRSVEKSATSTETMEIMTSMEPFLKYVFASMILMKQGAKPFIAAFREAQERMEEGAGFTTMEKQVMTYRLHGYSYKKIGSELDVSLNTVRSHIKSIHGKTDTRSHAELFAKYFVEPDDEHLPFASTKM